MNRNIVRSAAAMGWVVCAAIAANGQVRETWAATYTTPGRGLDYTYTIEADVAGNSYAAGFVENDAAVVSFDAGGSLRWTAIGRPEGFGWTSWISSTLDGDGNLIVTGRGTSATRGYELIVAKYAPDGTELWFQVIDGGVSGTDAGWSVLTDSANNVYIGAESTDGEGYGFAVYRLTPDGEIDWRTRLPDYQADFYFVDLVWDHSNRLALAASTPDSFVLARLAADGTLLWSDEYEAGGDAEIVGGVATDSQDNILVAVSSWSSDNGIDYLTLKVDLNGDTLWERRFDGRGSGRDVAWRIAVDSTDSVVVTGITEYDQLGYYAEWGTVKYGADGTLQWVNTYSVEGFYFIEDGPADIAIDARDNVYVGGTSFAAYTEYDLAVVKYSPAGAELWTQRYDGPEERSEVGGWMTLAPNGDIFLTGASTYRESGLDIIVVRYSERRPGDLNCDGSVDFNDIDAFVAALIDRENFESQYAGCDYLNGDINDDDSVDFNDIDGFVECLIGGGCE